MERSTGMWRRPFTRGGWALAVWLLVVLAACATPGTVRGDAGTGDGWLASDPPWPCYRGHPVRADGDSPRAAFGALLALKYGANCGRGCTPPDPAAPIACDAKYVFRGLADPAAGFGAGRIRLRLRFRLDDDPPGTWRRATTAFELAHVAAAAGPDTASSQPLRPALRRAAPGQPLRGPAVCTPGSAEPAGSPLGVARCFTGGNSDAGFGAGWHSPLQRRLEPQWFRVRAVRGDGSVLEYDYTQAGWRGTDPGAPRLRAWKGGWRVDLDSGAYEFYDAGGSIVADVAGDGSTTIFQRDAGGLLQAIIGPRGRRIHVERDERQRIVALADPIGSSCTYVYDSADRLEQVRCEDRPLLAYRYDAEPGGTTGVSLHRDSRPPRPVVPGSMPVAVAGGSSRR